MENKKAKVLIVDDDLLFGDITSKALKALGYDNVLIATSFYGVDSIIDEFTPSILVLDVEVGDQNGIDRSLAIKEKYHNLPIIFISANPLDDYISRAIETTGSVFLKKPCSAKELSTYIDKYAIESNHIAIGDHTLHINEKLLKNSTSETEYHLTNDEVKILLLLLNNKNQITTYDNIQNQFKNSTIYHSQKIYNVISKLRNIFKTDNMVNIECHTKIGYEITIIDVR